jgi:hypothetical protein
MSQNIPKQLPLQFGEPIHAYFDANDKDLIESSWTNPRLPVPNESLKRNVRECVAWALSNFLRRLMQAHPDGPPIDPATGNFVIQMCKPATAFDAFVSATMMQDIANMGNRGLDRITLNRAEGSTDPDFGRCPDVIFPDYTPTRHRKEETGS